MLWEDREFRRLSPIGKNAWFCCLTGSHTTMLPGLASVSVMRIADQICASVAATQKALKELEALGWIEFDRNMEVLRVVNAFKYNVPSNGDMMRGWMREWLRLPACELRSKHLSALKEVIAGSPTLLAVIEEEITLGRFENRDKTRTYLKRAAGKQEPAKDTVSTPSSDGVETVSTSVSSKKEEVREVLLSPRPAVVGAGGDDPAKQPTDEPTATAVHAKPMQQSLPATATPRKAKAAVPTDDSNCTQDRQRWLDRYCELKSPPFPPVLTKADCVFFAMQRKARGIDELLWVLETLHGDAYSAHSTVRQLLSPEAAQKAAGLRSRVAPKSLSTNPYEASLESARSLYRQAQAAGEWIPPEEVR
jgi:hypothetical protein